MRPSAKQEAPCESVGYFTLFDGLNIELERARELLKIYESIPTGQYGATAVKQCIEHAELSIRTQNLPEMIKAYQELQKLE